VIEEVVAPVLHDNEPIYPVAVRIELPQLLVTVTPGAASDDGADVPVPAVLLQPFIVAVTL
jgi:hypothetical protein